MQKRWRLSAMLIAFSVGVGISSYATAAGKPCEQIRKACTKAGFTKGGAKQGIGLIGDCIDPVMQGTSPPAKAAKPLPTIDPQLIAACRAADPTFGNKQDGAPQTAAIPAQPPAPPPPVAATPSPGGTNRPNFVFVLADDFSMNLVSSKIIAQSMPNLMAMMREGATFESYFVTDSLCCPSRSSIFTGKFPHDTGVFTNRPPLGGYEAFNAHGNEAQTFAVALQMDGYQTAMLGKYLNGYKPEKNAPPAGWNEWDVAGEGYPEFNYSLNQDGKVVSYGDRSDPKNYLTDVVAGLGEAFIRKSASGPFFIEIATFAPHAPYIPAPRHENDFPGLTYDRSSPFGARPDQNAPDWLKAISPLTPKQIAKIDKSFRMRVQSDQAIDEMIGKIRGLLTDLHLDKNTYVVFSSDNGYHMGEYSLRPGKMTSFDTDIHVPLVIVGPGIAPGKTIKNIVENVDLSPTFTDLAGGSSPATADGHSLVGLLHPLPNALPIEWRDEALIEHRHPEKDVADPDLPEAKSGNPPSYNALRTDTAMYVEYDDAKHEVGFYNLKADPLELKNIAGSLSAEQLKRWHEVLQANATCHGAQACWDAQRMKP
jgi:N-acetylglucosamine-6-sulfatase